MARKHPSFKTEAREAEWWAKNQDLIADRFEQAAATGTLAKGTVTHLARKCAKQSEASPTRRSGTGATR